MAHIGEIIRITIMRLKLRRLQNAKRIGLDIFQKREPKIGFMDRLHYWNAKYLHCGCIKTYFRVNQNKSFVLKLFEIYLYITTTGTFPNYILTAIVGFVGGVLISYLYFTLCAIILDLSTWSAFYISVILCFFLTLGMAFYPLMRCIVLSLLPEMCTSRARAMLVAFALLLLITGPGSNILFNTGQLTDTIACTHDQFSSINHNLTQIYKKPLRALRNSVVGLMQSLKPFIDKLKSGLRYIKEAFTFISQTIRNVKSWFKWINISCRTKMGTPFQMCYRQMQDLGKECEALFLEALKFLCEPLTTLRQTFCLVYKLVDVLCAAKEFIKDSIFDYLKTKILELGNYISTIFYVSVSFHHSWGFETNQTKSLKQVLKDVYHSQRSRLHIIFGVFGIMKFLIGTYIAYVLLSALIYRYRFIYQTRFDNRHINKFLIELDTRRARIGRQTIFPLTRAEKSYYVSLLSLRLTTLERSLFLRGSSLLFYSCVKVIFMLLIDIILWWVLTILHDYGRISFYFGKDRSLIGAEGSGIFYRIYTFFNSLLKPFEIELRFDTGPCLPQPIPPDWLTYERIGITMIFAWIMAFMQPVGIRFRNYVMSHYYPEAARRRAVWLYNHILQTRGYFTTFVRRQLLGTGSLGLRTERIDIYKWLIARFPMLYFILPFRNLYIECMVCGYPKPQYRCATPDCPGQYCNDCFASIGRICLSCNFPQDFQGLEISEEEDSDEDKQEKSTDQSQPWWKFWLNWLQVSTVEQISLRAMEEAVPTTAPQTPTPKPREPEPPAKDYFDEKWRRDDWATIDDFQLPMPDFSSWIRPRFQTTRAASRQIIQMKN